MKKVGVIGAGVIGAGVAQDFAEHGFRVILIDLTEKKLDQARSAIYRQLRFGRLLKTNKILEDVQLILNRITFTIDYQYLCDVDVVIENVTEDYYIKKNVYSDIDLICQSNCIFMVNTSCISITEIASLTRRKDKVIGVHFMNPVPMKTVVECIKGYHTSDETIQATKTLLLRLQKECLLVNDYPGFVSNRISHLFMNEAAFVIQDQVADPQTVDAIFKGAFSHKMGPLETADLIGIDTVVNSLDVLYQSYKDPKFRCCPLLRKMVSAGLLGRKVGQGFYQYQINRCLQ
jgi:3-hydroxybutyryl-CoA dehydrogenase